VRANEPRALGLAFNFVVLAAITWCARFVTTLLPRHRNSAVDVTGTLVTMLVANALFSAIVARMSRRGSSRSPPQANLIIFSPNAYLNTRAKRLGRACLHVWVLSQSFCGHAFLGIHDDVFNSEQAKRLFAFISVGGRSAPLLVPSSR
jgi:hypothetical protein